MASGLVFFSRADLKDNMVSWSAEDGLDDLDLNRAIALCEADMRRRLRILSSEKTEDLPITGETLRVPARFLSVRRAYIPGNPPLGYLSPNALIDHQLQRDSGRPSKYTLEGDEDNLPFLRFSARPDSQDYVLRLTYAADAGLISDDDCNAVLSNFGDLYFYGSLSHLAMFLRNEDRLPAVQELYENLIMDTIRYDIADKVDGSALTPRPTAVPA